MESSPPDNKMIAFLDSEVMMRSANRLAGAAQVLCANRRQGLT
tara:strand:- start:690 stop:818 length:129 start_codon:yes stop_codon:yes gene_type:complete